MGLSGRRGRTIVAAALFLLLAGELARFGGSFFRPAVDLDIGPSTARYVEGFTESEERRPVSFRWTTERASVGVPLELVAGPATLTLRYARFLEGSAEVRIFFAGRFAGSFGARSGRFRNATISLPAAGGPLEVELLVQDPDPTRLGIAVDWLRLEGARVRGTGWMPRIVLLGTFVLALASGLSLRRAVGVGVLVGVAQAIWLARSPFAMVHVHAVLGVTALVASGLVLLVVSYAPGGAHRPGGARLVPLLFLLTFFLKGAVLFHPSYYYPDVRLHRRHLEAFVAAEGSVVERGIAAQKAAFTAYPRTVAGRSYAFPYSPVFYLPFTLLDGAPRSVEAAMKHVGLLLAAAELPLVYLLARFLLGDGAGVWAALLTVFLPPSTSRLLFAQWPTLAGHLLDLVAIALAARMTAAPDEVRRLGSYGAAAFASCLVYVSSIVNLSLFTASVALFYRRRGALLLLWCGIVTATVGILYLPFARLFFSEILPAFMRGGTEASPADGLVVTLRHVYLFYGFGYPALAIAGLLRLRQRGGGLALRLLLAFGLSFLGLLALRSVSGMFKDLKDLVYAGPFFAITAAVALETLWTGRRAGRIAAVAVALGLAGFGLGKYAEYHEMHTRLAGLP